MKKNIKKGNCTTTAFVNSFWLAGITYFIFLRILRNRKLQE